MATGGFYDSVIGSLTSTNATNYLALQNQQNQAVYLSTQQVALSGYRQAISSYLGSTAVPPSRACEDCGAKSDERHKAACEYWKDRCECHAGKASKVHRFVELLRMELDAWHGDVLERCPA